MEERGTPATSADPGWRPQGFGPLRAGAIEDPRREPIVATLATSIRADSVVLDGYLTRQPNVDPALASKMGPAIPTHGQMLGQMFLGGGRAARSVRSDDAAAIDP